MSADSMQYSELQKREAEISLLSEKYKEMKEQKETIEEERDYLTEKLVS